MTHPTGIVTFLFTDIEGSTKLWDAHPDAMQIALEHHDSLLRDVIERNNGYVFKTVGDAFCAAFHTAADGLNAALEAHLALQIQEWDEKTGPLRVRMGLHTGEARERDNDYFGPTLNRTARLQAVAHGQQTLLTQSTFELVVNQLPNGCHLGDLGMHRLKDLAAPEHVWQALQPTLPQEFAPLKTLDYLPTNLPRQLTSFIGREKEMAEIGALLEHACLLTLTGSGGTGKTRLAVQTAAEVLDQYADGVWLVELAALSEAGLVPQKVAQALNVREVPGEPIIQTLLTALKDKQLLLVLDNCEHVLDASVYLTDAILRSCPKVKILASSREALGIAGEQAYRVPSLSLPDPGTTHTPESLSRYEAACLFIDRAIASRADFVVTSEIAPALASVCLRLDGIPLAIELAAVRVRSMTVAELHRRLDDRFRLLTGGSKTALPRQQTLRSMIDWSYDLLTEHEKTLFVRLSVFAGGWTFEAAEQVCTGNGIESWELLDLSASLVDKSLVIAEERGDTTRYRLLETVRQYARDRLFESGSGENWREKHLAHYLALAEEFEPQSMGPDQQSWLERLETEHDNLRTAFEWCAQSRDNGKNGLRLAGLLARFWLVRGHLFEGRQQIARALESVSGSAPAVRAKALIGAGMLAMSQGDFKAARALYEESLEIGRELDNKALIVASLNNLGSVECNQGAYEAARSLHEESLGIARELGRRDRIAASLNNLGSVAMYLGDYAAAQVLYQEALALNRELGNRSWEAINLHSIGSIAQEQGDFVAAQELFEEGLAIYRELHDRAGAAGALLGLGAVARNRGDDLAARTLHGESLTISQELGDRLSIANSLESLARLDAAAGLPIRASRLWGFAERLREEIGAPVLPANLEERDRGVMQARTALGIDADFDAAWAEGREMTVEEACEFALAG